MFYVTTHSTHFYLLVYDVGPRRHPERKPVNATTWATLFDWQQGIFYGHHPTDVLVIRNGLKLFLYFFNWRARINEDGAVVWKGMKAGRKEIFYLTTHSTHFIYGYMASDIW